MINIKNVLGMVFVLTAVSATAFAGCGGYKPDESEYYYDNGDTYRVIKLDGDKTEHIENYGIEAYNIPVEGIANVNAKCNGIIGVNTLFYDAVDNLTSEAVKILYRCLDIDEYPKVVDTAVFYNTSGLCTYNKKTDTGVTITYKGMNDPYEGGLVYGLMANANRYTISYTDYLKSNGKAVGNGSFNILLCAEQPHYGQFNYDDFTDLYSVKGADND